MADFYLQIRTDSMTLKNLETHDEHSAQGHFSSVRLIIGDYYSAEFVLRQLVEQMGLRVSLPFSTHHRVVVQALDKIEGGLSEVEIRLLKEVVSGGFAQKVKKIVVCCDNLPLPQSEAKALLENTQ